jgi:hypothetical protein
MSLPMSALSYSHQLTPALITKGNLGINRVLPGSHDHGYLALQRARDVNPQLDMGTNCFELAYALKA